jgi:carbonic anhydrase
MPSPHIRRTAPYASILVLLMFAVTASAQDPHLPHWSYSGAEGPVHWGSLDWHSFHRKGQRRQILEKPTFR